MDEKRKFEIQEVDNTYIMRISRVTSVVSASGFVRHGIEKALEDGKLFELRAIGASAVNQAVKAIARANAIFAPIGKSIQTLIYFVPNVEAGVGMGFRLTLRGL